MSEQMATIMMTKLDDGNRAVANNESSRGFWKKGDVIQNNNFLPYPKGTELKVLVSVSDTGRKMVQSINGKPVSAKVEMKNKVTNSMNPTLKPNTIDLDGYYISQEARLAFSTLAKMSLANPASAVKMMMMGPSGYGKTMLPSLFAKALGKRFMRMNCASIRDPEEWFGYREARNSSTIFIRSQFIEEVEKGDIVVVLDEFNRLEPWLHNTLFPLLDDDGKTEVHGETFALGEGVIIVGTINTGSKYTGIFHLDESLFNRFDLVLEVGPMPHEREVEVLVKRVGVEQQDAEDIVKIANIMRQSDIVCSNRTTLKIAAMVKAGMEIRQAFEVSVIRRLPTDLASNSVRKEVIDQVNAHLGAFSVDQIEWDVFGGGEQTTSTPAASKNDRIVVTLQKSNSVNTVHSLTVIQALSGLLVYHKTGNIQALTQKQIASHINQLNAGITVKIEFGESPEVVRNLLITLYNAGITSSTR